MTQCTGNILKLNSKNEVLLSKSILNKYLHFQLPMYDHMLGPCQYANSVFQNYVVASQNHVEDPAPTSKNLVSRSHIL